ncbi:hypothetical protein F5Y16DRAFT_400220 [Xylariaceae sp. FL0255]|nr:hypothetical protein F5Y16DRAFT_400220 [Xylariaceae sp. FL0255]
MADSTGVTTEMEMNGLPDENVQDSQDLGILTIRDTARNEQLFTERAMLIVDRDDQDEDPAGLLHYLKSILHNFQYHLSDQNKAKFYALRGNKFFEGGIKYDLLRAYGADMTEDEVQHMFTEVCSPEKMEILTRWYTNFVEMGDRGDGIFSTWGLLHHSCNPNAAWQYDKELGKMRVVAIADIAKGEEVFISYIPDILMTRLDRMKSLHFNCDCPACNLSPQEQKRSDLRRQLIANIMQSIDEYIIHKAVQGNTIAINNWDEALSLASRGLALLHQESLVSEIPLLWKMRLVCYIKQYLGM